MRRPGQRQPGQEVQVADRQFEVLVSKPVEFPLLVSSTRLTDRPGQLVPIDRQQMTPLPACALGLRTRRKADIGPQKVNLHARLTEIGTLDIWCRQSDGDQSWRSTVRRTLGHADRRAGEEGAGEAEGFVDETTWEQCRQVIADTFGPAGSAAPQAIFKSLAAATEVPRHGWPMSLLRRIWDTLLEYESGRQRLPGARDALAEPGRLRPTARLRPAMDDWRVAETWRALQGKIAHGRRRAAPSPGSSGGGSPVVWERASSGRWHNR